MRTALLTLGLAALGAAYFFPLIGIRDTDALPVRNQPITATDPDERAFEELANRTAAGDVLTPTAWIELLDGLGARAYELEPDGQPERLKRVSLFLAWMGRVWPWLVGVLLVLVLLTKSAPWFLRALVVATGTLYGGLAVWPLVVDAIEPESVRAAVGLGLWLAAAGGVLVFLVAPFGKRPVLTFFVGSLLPLVALAGIAAWIANA